MADLFGVNHNKKYKQSIPEHADFGTERGRVRTSTDYFKADAVATAGDVIYLQRIPAGARIIGVQVFNPASNLSAVGGNANIGWSASEDAQMSGNTTGVKNEVVNPTGFFAALDLSIANKMDEVSDLVALPAGFDKAFEADVFLTATVTTDTVAVDGSVLGVRVLFVQA